MHILSDLVFHLLWADGSIRYYSSILFLNLGLISDHSMPNGLRVASALRTFSGIFEKLV